MRHTSLSVLILSAGIAFGQSGRTYSSPGGFGNILYPGTGHAPNAHTGVPPARGYGNGYANGRAGYAPGRVSHPGHSRTAVVPYPVIVGGYGYGYGGGGYYDQGAPQQQYADAPAQVMGPNGAPSVVINQTFIPDRAVPVVREYGPDQDLQDQGGMRMHEGLRTVPQVAPGSDQPTLYLIAMKDHSIVQALGYWVEGRNLKYVSVEHSVNEASLDLIDRDLSQRLNEERSVEFRLPKQ